MFKETLDLIKGLVTFMRSRSNIAGTAIVAASLMSGVSFADASTDYKVTTIGVTSLGAAGTYDNQNQTTPVTLHADGDLSFEAPTDSGGDNTVDAVNQTGAPSGQTAVARTGTITLGPITITNLFGTQGTNTNRLILNAGTSAFPGAAYSSTDNSAAATNIHADLAAINNAAVSVPTYVSQLNVTVANTNDITFAANNPTLKLTNTLDPSSSSGLKMNGGTVEVAANIANMVPPVADFDTTVNYQTKKKLKFSAIQNANPLASGVTGYDFTSYSGVFDRVEWAFDGVNLQGDLIKLDSSQTLEISANIIAPGHGGAAGKVVTGTVHPIKITGPAPTLQSIPGVLQDPAGTVITTATLDIGATLTNALDLSSKGIYSTVDITNAGNTTGLTLPTGATLKLSQTYLPADAGLKMNGGTVDVHLASTANIVPAVAKFDVNSPYNTKKTLKFSVAHDASPLSGVSGLNFTTYNTVFDTIELAAGAANFANQDITLHSSQTLKISADIDAPGHNSGSGKVVTGTATPTIKITGTAPTIDAIPGVLHETAAGTVLTTGATLDIGANLTNALDLTSKGVYSTVDITSAGNTTQITAMPANATLKLSNTYRPSSASTLGSTNKVEVTGQGGYLDSAYDLHELDGDFTVTGGHVIFSHDGVAVSKGNLKDALTSQTLGLAAAAATGTAKFTTLQINNSFDAPANGTPFTLGAGSTLILNNATLLTNTVKFESSASSYPMVKVTNTANGAVGTQGSPLTSVILAPQTSGNQYDLSIGEGLTSSTDVYFTPPTGAAFAHVRKLILSGGNLRSDIATLADPISQGTIEFNGGTVDSSNKIYAVNSTVELKNAAAVTNGFPSIVAGEIEGYNNTLVLAQNEQLGTFLASGFGSFSTPFVFSSFTELDTAGGKLLTDSYLKLTKTSTDLALDTLEVSSNYYGGGKIALELNNTDLVLGGRTLPAEIDAILVENGHNTSLGGTQLNLQMTSPTARTIWNAQFKYTDPTATRVSPTFTAQNNAVHVSGLQPGTEVYRSNSTGNFLAFYDVPGDFVIRAQSNSSANAWTVCTNVTCAATAGGSKIFTLTTADHGVDGYLSFSEESQALVDTRYEFLGSKVASIVNRSSGDNGFTKYGFRSTRAASSKAPKYSAMTSGMSYKTDMSNMVSVAKGVKSTVGIEFTHGKVIDAKNLAFGTYVAMDKDLMPTVAVGGVYNMNYETLIRSNIPTGATTIGSHDKDVAHFFTHTANLHATKSDILKFAGHSLGARLNFNALFTPKFVSSGVTYHKNDLYQVVPELTLDMKLGMLGLNGKLTGAYYSYLGDFKQEISITNGANTVTEKYEIDGKTGVFAQLELDKSISKHAKLSVNGTLGEHKLYSLGLALKVEA